MTCKQAIRRTLGPVKSAMRERVRAVRLMFGLGRTAKKDSKGMDAS